jgi:hypothetical protein
MRSQHTVATWCALGGHRGQQLGTGAQLVRGRVSRTPRAAQAMAKEMDVDPLDASTTVVPACTRRRPPPG